MRVFVAYLERPTDFRLAVLCVLEPVSGRFVTIVQGKSNPFEWLPPIVRLYDSVETCDHFILDAAGHYEDRGFSAVWIGGLDIRLGDIAAVTPDRAAAIMQDVWLAIKAQSRGNVIVS